MKTTILIPSAILLILLGFAAGAISEHQSQVESPTAAPQSELRTVEHEGHRFIYQYQGFCVHHPDCPCLTKQPTEKQ